MALFDGFLLVSDVDATLLDEKKNIPAANLAAIRRFKALAVRSPSRRAART